MYNRMKHFVLNALSGSSEWQSVIKGQAKGWCFTNIRENDPVLNANGLGKFSPRFRYLHG